MGSPVSAKNARVRINANIFEGTRWRAKATNKKIDVTNFEGNGYSDAIGSINDAEFDVEGFWNSANNPWTPPTTLFEGITLTNLSLYLNATAVLDGLRWFFPTWLCEETEMDSEVRDGMKIKFSGCNKGVFYRPGYTP